MIKKYIPFPVGTVRGPYTCGWGNNSEGGIQYLVQTKTGWVPFIRSRKDYTECEQSAKEYSEKVLTGAV